MKKHPILISIPHGGTAVPADIRDRVTISAKDQFEDSDAFTQEIYGLGDAVRVQVQTQVARVFVDMNRAADDQPPQNPDGVVKTQTCHGKIIYLPGKELDDAWTRRILETYYLPYHQSISAALAEHADLQLALDCHSMENVAPVISPDPGQPRPLICLGTNHGKSCPPAMADRLAACFREAFGLEGKDVVMNKPFAGGYITRTYGEGSLPWVQVEMNRSLYLSKPWFDAESLTVQPQRLKELNDCFGKTLSLFFES
ncbi:MAG: N-formylglutamate amidohydrolase [Nitrospinota bacterium]|nr:N-formylglutamate amidohydrolase [Nitrospinota bacterium]